MTTAPLGVSYSFYIAVPDVLADETLLENLLLPLLMSARLNQTHLAQLPSGPADVSAMDEENPPGPAELLPLAED